MPSSLVRIRESDLREAVTDRRYRDSGHPEREAFVAWVMDGFCGLYPNDTAEHEAVWVRGYVRDGHAVKAHWRAAMRGEAVDQQGGDAQPVVFRELLKRFLRAPSGGRTSPPIRR